MPTPAMTDTLNWRAYREQLKLLTHAFIDGEFCESASGADFVRINPATGEVLANVTECEAADVNRAVMAARRAFEDGCWHNAAPAERKQCLLRWAALIREHASELALIETLETGKPITETRRVDAPSCADTIAWYAEALDKLYDEVAPTAPGTMATITREPIGVVAAVVPWNYPMIIASWKIGPALAVGNSVILKPAEQSPLAALKLAQLAHEAGIPAGVFQVLPGRGEVTGEALGLHDDVDMVAFTGSTEIGKRFLHYAAESNMKRISLECGGKSPQIVTRDCGDLDKAAQAIAYGIWYNQGETCHAGSRLIVDRQIKEALMQRLLAWVEYFQPGNPLDETTTMGALIEQGHMERVLGYIDLAREEGAQVRAGGKRVLAETGGYFIEPTVLNNVDNRMRVAREEIFGPVLVVIDCDGLDEAIDIANDSCYGLAAAVWTDRMSDAHRATQRLRAGTVWVNCYDQASLATPFGGYKQSGIGRDRSLHAFDKYTETKTTWVEF